MKCRKCGSTNMAVRTNAKNPNQTDLYCADCGAWQKFASKDEIKLYSEQGVRLDGWRKITPILPAPGVRVMLACKKFVGEGYRNIWGEFYRYEGTSWEHIFGSKPTLWMPMPTVGKGKQE